MNVLKIVKYNFTTSQVWLLLILSVLFQVFICFAPNIWLLSGLINTIAIGFLFIAYNILQERESKQNMLEFDARLERIFSAFQDVKNQVPAESADCKKPPLAVSPLRWADTGLPMD